MTIVDTLKQYEKHLRSASDLMEKAREELMEARVQPADTATHAAVYKTMHVLQDEVRSLEKEIKEIRHAIFHADEEEGA